MSNIQLKGNNPNDPWWVVEGTPGEIAQQIAQVFPDLGITEPAQFPSMVAKARERWAAQVTLGAVLGGTETAIEAAPAQGFTPAPQQSAPQAPAAPARSAPECVHGPMTFRSGTKNGREWRAHFCPQPKGSPDQCAPVWG